MEKGNQPNFITQYNKIVNAYLKNELKPCLPCACFVGNLLNNTREWIQARGLDFEVLNSQDLWIKEGKSCILEEGGGVYTPEDIFKLESNFMKCIYGEDLIKCEDDFEEGEFEEAIYQAMESTLLILKEIHISKGEMVEDYIFTKRNLEIV